MIKPASLWAMLKTADERTIGRVGATLGGREVDPPLNAAERVLVDIVRQDSEWMDERVEESRERDRLRKQRSRGIRDVTRNPSDTTDSANSAPSVRPSVPSVRPSVQTNNNSVPLPLPLTRARNGNGNGTGEILNSGEIGSDGNGDGDGTGLIRLRGGSAEARRAAERFIRAVDSGRQDAFFDADHDVVTICAAATGDYRSTGRWRQLANSKGEDAVRQEVFAFWRELAAGEDVRNRGAALNRRLGNLPDAARG